MIVAKKNWISLVLSLRGSTFVNIWPRVVAILLISIIVELASQSSWLSFSLTAVPFTVVGLALAIFLGFRNSAAYDRYWEGRKLWGAQVNVARNFAMQTRVLQPSDQPEATTRVELVEGVLAFTNSLRHRLRQTSPEDDLKSYLKSDEIEVVMAHDNIPVAILDLITQKLIRTWQAGRIETYQLTALQKDLSKMLDVQGGCERILATPIPFTYSVLTHRTVMLYCLALPLGLHDTVGWGMPVVATFIAFAFLGLDDLGDEIEQPFGVQPNSLPLHAICRTIEINLLQLIEQPENQVPDPVQPVDDILL